MGLAMKEEITIRKMKAEDVAAIMDLDRRISGKERAPSWPQRVTRYLEMYYPPLCFVAERDSKVIGFILGDMRGWEYALPVSGWIDIMGVDPEYREQGIGRKLVSAFVEECHRRGMRTHIIVREDDERLRRFLVSLDFQRGKLTEYEK